MRQKILAFIFEGENFLALRNNSKDLSHGGDFWATVSGSLEKEEINEDAVKREVKEETGLDVGEIFDLNWKTLYDWNGENCSEKNFLVFVDKSDIILNEEHVEYEWLSIDHFIRKIKWYLDKGFLTKVLKFAIKRQKFIIKERIDDLRR